MTNTPNNITIISKDNFDLVTTFCIIDDFFRFFSFNVKGRKSILSVSEMATICLIQQVYEVKCLKRLYELVRDRFAVDFKLPAYKNFVVGLNKAGKYLLLFLYSVLSVNNTANGEICFVDSTKIEVCKIYREKRHKTMKSLATKHMSTTGWFYGLRLHLICDRQGNLIKIRFTTATYSERQVLDDFLNNMSSWCVVGDAGYLDKDLEKKASQNDNILITAKRKNMKTLHTIWQNSCINLRNRIETVFDVLKERYDLVTSSPRSVNGYLAHYIRCLFCYVILG
jgi:Transposase DDE domain